MDEGSLRRIASVDAYMAQTSDLDRFDYATELALRTQGLPKEECKEENRVLGCDSQLWYRLSETQGTLRLLVESDSLLVKGLALMLADACAQLPVPILGRQPLGLGMLLYTRGWIPLARKRGLEELEEIIYQFARQCQKPSPAAAATSLANQPVSGQ